MGNIQIRITHRNIQARSQPSRSSITQQFTDLHSSTSTQTTFEPVLRRETPCALNQWVGTRIKQKS